MVYRRVWILALVSLVMATAGCAGAGEPAPTPGRMPVVAAFYPLYEFAGAVGGDRVDVTNLVPSGAEPHDYDPSPRDIERIQQARLMVYVGSDFQPGLEKAIESAEAPNLAVLDVMVGTELLTAEEAEHEDEEEDADHGHVGGYDPHIWLDPTIAKAIVLKVRDALIQADPSGREIYAGKSSSPATLPSRILPVATI
jgi:zinc transport system substrate-binding protein